jgi:lysophospholipase L1-like esterase
MPRRFLLAARTFGILVCCSAAANSAPLLPDGPGDGSRWVETWGSAQMVPGQQDALPAAQWRDATLRQIVRVSLGGAQLRVRVSNVFGTQPLVLDAASVALSAGPGRADVDSASLRPLRFDGHAGVTIPAGAEYVSDPVEFTLSAGADLAVSMRFHAEPARQSGHPGARATSFIAQGDRVLDARWPRTDRVEHWYQLAGVEVLAAPGVHTVAAIGDSITDGHGATTDGNDRWTDALALRLRANAINDVGVVNTGIGGGRLLLDGLGPNLASRFERDVLARAGVSHAVVMIGVNDLGVQHKNKEDSPAGRASLLADLRQAHRQLVQAAHARGVCVIGATITPYAGSGYYAPGADNEQDRQSYNKWIRESGVFDGVADFDAALRDPARPDRILKPYDSGDGLHPSPAGFRAMADAVPLADLKTCRIASRPQVRR